MVPPKQEPSGNVGCSKGLYPIKLVGNLLLTYGLYNSNGYDMDSDG